MYEKQPKKLLIVNILDILEKYSDENHRLSQKDIFHGNGVTQEQWIERYKTDEKYGWGIEQELTQEQ